MTSALAFHSLNLPSSHCREAQSAAFAPSDKLFEKQDFACNPHEFKILQVFLPDRIAQLPSFENFARLSTKKSASAAGAKFSISNILYAKYSAATIYLQFCAKPLMAGDRRGGGVPRL